MDILWYSLLLTLLLWHGHPCRSNCDYLERETTDAIKGFFIGAVFFRHFVLYAEKGLVWHPVDIWLHQLIVVMFLFYSGYGIMVQYAKRGKSYIWSIPRKRVLTTLVNFDIAVVLFGILGLLLGRTFSIKHFALSLVGWESIGNSNWYIFVILLCYATTFASFILPIRQRRTTPWERILFLCFFFLVYVFLIRRVKPHHWHDTVFAFWGGIAYGLFHEQFEPILDKYWFAFLAMGIAGTFAFPLLPETRRWLWAVHNARALCFALAIVTASRRIQIDCGPLTWCGRNLFPLYIYQRIPMLLCKHFCPTTFTEGGMKIWLPCLFTGSLVVTLGIARAYPFFRYPRTASKTPVVR